VRRLHFARALIIEQTGKTKGEHFGEAVAFYLSVFADPRATLADNFRAQEGLNDLLGLVPPRPKPAPDADDAGGKAGRAEVRFYLPVGQDAEESAVSPADQRNGQVDGDG